MARAAARHIVVTGRMEVRSGRVDVFARREDGWLLPLMSADEGEYVYPLPDVELIAVPHIGSEWVSAPEDPGVPGMPGFGHFLHAIDVACGSHATDVDEIEPGELSVHVRRMLRYSAETRRQQRESTVADRHQLLDRAYRQMVDAGSELALSNLKIGDDDLTACIRVLGTRIGFGVERPSRSEFDQAPDALAAIARTSGFAYRWVQIGAGTPDSEGDFLGFLVTRNDETTGEKAKVPEPVVVTKRRGELTVQRPHEKTGIAAGDLQEYELLDVGVELFGLMEPVADPSFRSLTRWAFYGQSRRVLLVLVLGLLVTVVGLLTPLMTTTILTTVIPLQDTPLLVEAGAALVLAALLGGVFAAVQVRGIANVAGRVSRRLSPAIWYRTLTLPAPVLRRFTSGDLARRVATVDAFVMLISASVVVSLLSGIFSVVYLGQMVLISPVLAIPAAVLLAASAVLLLWSLRRLSHLTEISIQGRRESTALLSQMLRGVAKLRISGAEPIMQARYLEKLRTIAVSEAHQTVVMGRVGAWFAVLTGGSTALFVAVVWLQWEPSGSSIPPAIFIAFTASFGLAIAAISGLSALLQPLSFSTVAFQQLRPLLTEQPETSAYRQDPGLLTGRIEFRDVHFRYSPNSPLVLRGVDLEVLPGQMIAILGTSGAGKSTLARLLLGFDIPERGQVLLDGRDLTNLDPTLVRRQIGTVLQGGSITPGTVMDNIVGSSCDDEGRAWRAAERAAVKADIEAMPMGMRTLVEPGNISGGQAQRIMLARALAWDPSIVVLDEATSALDNAAQEHVTQSIQELGATRMVIAHRLSTIQQADVVVALDQGRIVESGTFDELLTSGGFVASLVQRQML